MKSSNRTVNTNTNLRLFALASFFLAGMTGLVYEILWRAHLSRILGNSTQATALVVAGFMGGSALGSLLAARLVRRWRRLIPAYGTMIAVVGLYTWLLPILARATHPLLRASYGVDGPTGVFIAVRLVTVLALVLLPSTLLGMTLPTLGAHFARTTPHAEDERRRSVPGRRGSTTGRRGKQAVSSGRMVALLHGLNCAGAVIGAVAGSFLLIPNLGLTITAVIAGSVNVLSGSVAWIVGHHATTPLPKPQSATELVVKVDRRQKRLSPTTSQIILLLFAGSGMAAMMHQVTWTRVFSLLFGSSTYVFSMVVAAFICGLSLGSLLVSYRVDGLQRPERWIVGVEAAIGVSGFVVAALMRWAPLIAAQLYPSAAQLSFTSLSAVQFFVVFGTIIVPTTLMGTLLPLVTTYLNRHDPLLSRTLGHATGLNTLGCVLGALIAGFVAIPILGLRSTLLAASIINGSMALMLWSHIEGHRFGGLVTIGGGTTLLLITTSLVVPSWDTAILTSAPYLYAAKYHDLASSSGDSLAETIRAQGSIVYHREGESAVVTVRRHEDGATTLHVNGKADASSHLDMTTQLLVSHLPMLLARNTERAMVVGLGSGASLGAIQTYDVTAIDCVEISPEIVDASAHFIDATGHDLTSSRLRLIVDAGRAWLDLSGQRYDVIVSQPSNPWIAGMTSLFTREYFDLCRSRLSEGGVMAQWIQAYGMSDEDFRSLIKTFHAVFPSTLLFTADGVADFILVGMVDHDPIDGERIRERFARPSVQESLATIGIRLPDMVFTHFLGGPATVDRLAQGGRWITDDNLALEYSAPRHVLVSQIDHIHDSLQAAADPTELASAFSGSWVAQLVEPRTDRTEAEELIRRASRLIDQGDVEGAFKAVEASYRLDPSVETTRLAYEGLLRIMARRAAAADPGDDAHRHRRPSSAAVES